MQPALQPLLRAFCSQDPATRDHAARRLACLLAWHNMEPHKNNPEIRKQYSSDLPAALLDLPLSNAQQLDIVEYLLATAGAASRYDPAPLAPLSYTLPELTLGPLLEFFAQHVGRIDAKSAIQGLVCLIDLLDFPDHQPQPDLIRICHSHDPMTALKQLEQRALAAKYAPLIRAVQLTIVLLQPFVADWKTLAQRNGSTQELPHPSELYLYFQRLAAYEAMPRYPAVAARHSAFIDLVDHDLRTHAATPRAALLLSYGRTEMLWLELAGRGKEVIIGRTHSNAGVTDQDLVVPRSGEYFEEFLARLGAVNFNTLETVEPDATDAIKNAALIELWLQMPGQPIRYSRSRPTVLAGQYPELYPLLSNLCSKPPELMATLDSPKSGVPRAKPMAAAGSH